MKKIIIVLLAGILLLVFNSCTDPETNYNYSIKDALKISAFLFDENCGEDYFVYRDEYGGYQYNYDEDVYELKNLKLNEISLMAPFDFFGSNLSISFEFDGIIEVIAENKDVQMYVNPKNLTEPITNTMGNEPYGFEMKVLNEGFISFNPLSSNRGHLWSDGLSWLPYQLGREYYLNVNAYKFDNEQSPIIKAQLKLVHTNPTLKYLTET